MDEVSVKLYKYMCDEVVGSEKVVNCRRQFFNVLDDVNNDCGDNEWRVISSGSKAEGLDLPGSDFDVMLINEDIHVYELDYILSKYHNLRTKYNLVLNLDDAMPGFTLLNIYDVREWDRELICINEDGIFLSNKSWKRECSRRNDVINGPCLSDALGTIDRAFSLKYIEWPSTARQWIDRPRFCGWPPESLIHNIVSGGVLLVPIGSKSDSQKDNPLEWRISFSVPEKMLIYSWTHSQIICYALLKLLLKEVIKKNENVDKLFCSYFLKTVIFWLSEELEQNVWTPNNLLNCFMLCLKRLIYWITYRYLPNYFIPQHNMIDRRIPGQSRDELLSVFHSLYDMGWGCIMLCDSLKHFSCSEIGLNSRSLPTLYTEFEKAVFSLLGILQKVMPGDEYKLHVCMRRCYIKIKNRKLPFNIRRLYFIAFLYLNSNITDILFKKPCNPNNKQIYFQTKQTLSHCMIETKNGALSGWVLLGLYFYLNKQYKPAIHVLEYTKSLTSIGQLFVSIYSLISIKDMLSETNKIYEFINSFQKFKLKTARVIRLKTETNDKSFIKDELLQRFPGSTDLFCHPGVLLHYLMFISYHRLNDTSRRQDCLQDLVLYVTTVYSKLSPIFQLFSLLYLRRAFTIISDTEGVDNCDTMLKTLMELPDIKIISSPK